MQRDLLNHHNEWMERIPKSIKEYVSERHCKN
jgi:hypothetical protein